MTRPAFQRDNILNSDERAASARKCVQILNAEEHCTDRMGSGDYIFYLKHRTLAKNLRYAPSEPELQWLRDLIEKYVTQ